MAVAGPQNDTPAGLAKTTKVVLVVEYEGTKYSGFQLQADRPAIQGEIEKAVFRLTGERLRLIAASRTDTGVHAQGQVVSFRTASSYTGETFIRALNFYLPGDIAVRAAYRVRDSVHVRRDATSREYRYSILNSRTRSPLKRRFTCQVIQPLDEGAMDRAARTLIGVHDFASFGSSLSGETSSTVREVYRAGVERKGELVIFNIEASSFLRHQVRNTVGSLIKVGLGSMSFGDFCAIIDARKPGLAGPAALPCGLCLVKVNYPYQFNEEEL